LLQAQLAREAVVRQRVNEIKANLLRGLACIRSLVAAAVPEFQSHISSVVRLLLEGALARGALLAQVTAFETYLVRSLILLGLFSANPHCRS
jgi:hypothetical protein